MKRVLLPFDTVYGQLHNSSTNLKRHSFCVLNMLFSSLLLSLIVLNFHHQCTSGQNLVAFVEDVKSGLKAIGVIGDTTEQDPILNEHDLPFIIRLVLFQVTAQIDHFVRNTLDSCVDSLNRPIASTYVLNVSHLMACRDHR